METLRVIRALPGYTVKVSLPSVTTAEPTSGSTSKRDTSISSDAPLGAENIDVAFATGTAETVPFAVNEFKKDHCPEVTE